MAIPNISDGVTKKCYLSGISAETVWLDLYQMGTCSSISIFGPDFAASLQKDKTIVDIL